MGMTTTQTTETLRSQYKTLMNACLKNHSHKPADFNRRVEGMIRERADGEVSDLSPASWYDAACEVAYYEYNVNFRHVPGCVAA